ncbi:MAG: hypothetical protein IID59_09450 [Proteobacteria bacterium]|nr:hypothetical protein [Pseudomonadota bacterium]
MGSGGVHEDETDFRNTWFFFAFLAACEGAPASTDTLLVDVGAVAKQNTVTPVDGITSAGQPDQAALTVFGDNGYVAIIDMRGEREDRGMDERAVVESLGMDYVLLPIASEDDISFENAQKLDDLLAAYDGPVLVHCASGNRVGALLALRQSMNGADDEAAIEYGKQGGLTGLEPVVQKRLAEK